MGCNGAVNMSLNPVTITPLNESGAPIAILCKDNTMQLASLKKYYFEPLMERGVLSNEVAAYPLTYPNGKATIKQIREHLGALLPNLVAYGAQYLIVNDGAYFKELTKQKKSDANSGYVLPCAYEGFTHLNVILGVNYKTFYFDAKNSEKLHQGINALFDHINGSYQEPGHNVISDATYVMKHECPKKHFDFLLKQPELELDIEAFSLKFWLAGIATIGFSYGEGSGIVFQSDYVPLKKTFEVGKGSAKATVYGEQIHNPEFKKALLEFLLTYEGTITYHNGNYDIKVLIYELFMDGFQDYAGMIHGIKILTKNFHDTKLIRYLATNSCAGNKLSLKDVAQEFAGNYAEADITDITKIKLPNLMKYNLIDCLSTRYARLKHYPEMVADEQLSVYETIFRPSVAVLLQSELVGMPLDMEEVLNTKRELTIISDAISLRINNNPHCKEYMRIARNTALIEKNLSLKRDVRTAADFLDMKFNPNSDPQKADLLHNFLAIPFTDKTPSGKPSVGAKSLKRIINTVKLDDEAKDLMKAFIEFADVSIILNNFIKSFIENSVLKEDGIYWLHGSFNLGGTVSGRLSSSAPNLQNIPSSGTPYAKHIKRCFKAPPGWLFVGVDFASLEDRISALTTRDPEKLKVYTDGYDGHCLRAYAYFPDRMPDIVEQMNLAIDNQPLQVEIINSIAELHEDVRQDSKPPTFLLTYGGTWMGLHSNVGLSKELAKQTEENYHNLYVESDNWVKAKILQASKDGYVTVAFGLRLRTPILTKTMWSDDYTVPYEARSESRTAGNALGQSYGMLNNRAAIEFQTITFLSDYSLDILPSAPIHDAQYFVIRDDIEVVKWFNDNLIPCMQWQELEEIKHPTVKLGGDLEIFYPNWANKIAIPNFSTELEIIALCDKAIIKMDQA